MHDKRLQAAVAYGIAVLLAVLAQLVRTPLHSPAMIPYVTYAPFILLAAYFGGLGPGLLATALCVIESLYFATEPLHSFRVGDPRNWLGLGALACTGVVASALFERVQRGKTAAAVAERVRLEAERAFFEAERVRLEAERVRLEAEQAFVEAERVRLEAERAFVEAERVRLEAERAFEVNRCMLESIVEHSPVPIALLSGSDFRFKIINPAYQALAPGEPMTGRTVAEVWPEMITLLAPLLERVRETGLTYQAKGLRMARHRGIGLPPEDRYFDVSYAALPGAEQGAPESESGRVLMMAAEVTEQQRAHEVLRNTLAELKAALAAKTVLLKEVHHRVKNNLAVIASLLGIKAGVIEGAEARAALEDSQQRVRSIAMIHERLSGSDRLDRIGFAEVAAELLEELRSVYGGTEGRIAVRLETEPIEMGLHRAFPCALILNELVTNALKYAFPDGRKGEVVVRLRLAVPGELELSVEDNGVGCPREAVSAGGKSLGFRIVQILAKQLEGTLEQVDCAGARFVLRFRAGTSQREEAGAAVVGPVAA
jgi:two-component sensor histidine kinase/PAS domain-containing protein